MTVRPQSSDESHATTQRRTELLNLLGALPMRAAPPVGQLLSAEITPHARIERWALTLNTIEPVPAILLLPPSAPPRGVVLYCHAHGNRFARGKDELLLGRPALQSPPYGEILPMMGYAVLAIDHWCFGERFHAQNTCGANQEQALAKQLLWEGKTLWGYRVHDALESLRWLRTQPTLADLPAFTFGLSMGSTMALWLAALDTTISACIELCCYAEFDALIETGAHDLHGEYFFIPGLRKHFTAAEIGALIAPRPHCSLVGRDDPLTPAAGVASVDAALRNVYSALGQSAAWQQYVFNCGHQETAEMRAMVLAFFERAI